MLAAKIWPFQLVDLYRTGLETDAGIVPLDQYMCSNNYNGGNDNPKSLFGKLRKAKDQGTGPTLWSLIGDPQYDIMLKGQGSPQDFVKFWNFMLRNKELLKKTKVEVCTRRDRKAQDTKIVERTGTVYDLYFKDKGDAAALHAMVRDRFFGIDCIGFIGNYLMQTGIYTKYVGWTPENWGLKVFKDNIKSIDDVEQLDILLWKGHIAIIDWIWKKLDDRTIEVDICQSSSSDECQGPQCNARVQLKLTNKTDTVKKGEKTFERSVCKIQHIGSPRMPVNEDCVIMSMKGLH